MFFKIIQNILSPFYVKNYKGMLDISIKSNRKHHKTVLYSKSNKNMVGQLFGQFFIFFGRFFNKNICIFPAPYRDVLTGQTK
jgi:hypothetical protein